MKVAAITGANRGIDLALVRNLCKTWGETGIVILTARNKEKGLAAVARLEEEGLHPEFLQLDMADRDSIQDFSDQVRSRYGGLDVFISNAAFAPSPDIPAAQEVRDMIETNNHGTEDLLNAVEPLLRKGSRVLVVASGFGVLSSLPDPVRSRLAGDDLTPEDVRAVMDTYIEEVETGKAGDAGWPDWINIPSKVGQVALMRAVARRWQADSSMPQDVVINAVCPGWTWTDAARPYLGQNPSQEAKQPDEAAVDVIWLATLPPGSTEPYGELVRYRQVLAFHASD